MKATEHILSITHKLKGRESSISIYAVLALFLLINLFPAFMLTSCKKYVNFPDIDSTCYDNNIETRIILDGESGTKIRSLDIFIFNDDALRRLDSYRRYEGHIGNQVIVASRGGIKLIVVIANAPKDRADWAKINSYNGLGKIFFDLKDENPDFPIMSGEVQHKAIYNGKCDPRIEPLMAEIVVKSLCCDFSSRPYAGKQIENARIYLTNVSAGCPAMFGDNYSISSLINYGRLSEKDYIDFQRPDMIEHKLNEPLGIDDIAEDIRLYCYPNYSTEKTLANPATRLVVEGNIDGRLYYYPIEINRIYSEQGGLGHGIERNASYEFDIMITRLGAKDPDISIESGSAGIVMNIKKWKEREDELIIY